MTTVVRFITPPPIPDVPEPIRGKRLLTIDGACIGDRAQGEATIAPLREIGETVMDTFEWMPTPGLSRIHMDPENPVAGVGEGGALRELTDEAVDAFVSVAGPDSGSPLLLTELRQLGGALGRPADGGGALSHLDAGWVFYSVGMPMTPSSPRRSPPTCGRSTRPSPPGVSTAATSTSPRAPATSTRSCRPPSAPASPR